MYINFMLIFNSYIYQKNLMRLKFQKRSALKLVSRIIPRKQGLLPGVYFLQNTSLSPPLMPAKYFTSFLRDSISYCVVIAICSITGEPPP